MSFNVEDLLKRYIPKINKSIEAFLPRHFDEQTIQKFFSVPKYAYDVESADKTLLDPVWDLLDRGGKRWRPLLVCLMAEALGGKIEDVMPIAVLCELVHNGSLVIDDIEDDSKMRRGKPCVHLLYNVDVAINAGCFLYFAPLYVLKDMRKSGKYSEEMINRCYELYSEEMIKIHLGQGLDIWWHNGKKNPSVDEYLQMCAYKTGTLARLSARIAVLICNGSEELLEKMGVFAESIGVAFQIQDDILNLVGEEFSQKIACVGEDICEGKRSLMVIHTIINGSPEDSNRLTEILNMKTRDTTLINEAIDIMKKNNSIEYSVNVARDIVIAAWNDIEPLLPHNNFKELLKSFSHYLINRKF